LGKFKRRRLKQRPKEGLSHRAVPLWTIEGEESNVSFGPSLSISSVNGGGPMSFLCNRTLLCLFSFVIASIRVYADLELVDAVVATVDKEVILYSDIRFVIGPELENIRKTAASQSDYDRRTNELVRDALEEAIESKILLREARKLSIEISDDIVEEQVEDLRKGYPNEEAFMSALRERGESLSDYRTRTRDLFMALALAREKLRLLA